jgi:hypothetical protein
MKAFSHRPLQRLTFRNRATAGTTKTLSTPHVMGRRNRIQTLLFSALAIVAGIQVVLHVVSGPPHSDNSLEPPWSSSARRARIAFERLDPPVHHLRHPDTGVGAAARDTLSAQPVENVPVERKACPKVECQFCHAEAECIRDVGGNVATCHCRNRCESHEHHPATEALDFHEHVSGQLSKYLAYSHRTVGDGIVCSLISELARDKLEVRILLVFPP